MLAQKLRQECVEGSRASLETLEIQERIGFRDIVTDKESWIYLGMNPNSIWIRAGGKVPYDRARDSIRKSRADCVLGYPQCGARELAPSRCILQQRVVQPRNCPAVGAELQGEGQLKHPPWTLLHLDNATPHTSKPNLAIMEELRPKCTAHPLFSLDIAPSDFVLFGWLKIKLASRIVANHNELSQFVQAILGTFNIETIAIFF
jgi:hypothetical protein